MAEEATDVTEVQDTSQTDSSSEENKELEVVESGEELDPNDFKDDETSEGSDDSTEESKEGDSEQSDEDSDEKPLGEKGQKRVQKLANENRHLKEYISKLEVEKRDPIPEYDIQDAIENKLLTPEQARIEALEHKQNALLQHQEQDRQSQELQELNVAVRNDADAVTEDFSHLVSDEKDAGLLVETWENLAGVRYKTDDNGELLLAPDGAPIVEDARFSMYDLASVIDHYSSASQRAGETNGQKAAEQKLSAVEPRPTKQVKTDNRDDASLSSSEYAKKYGLQIER